MAGHSVCIFMRKICGKLNSGLEGGTLFVRKYGGLSLWLTHSIVSLLYTSTAQSSTKNIFLRKTFLRKTFFFVRKYGGLSLWLTRFIVSVLYTSTSTAQSSTKNISFALFITILCQQQSPILYWSWVSILAVLSLGDIDKGSMET